MRKIEKTKKTKKVTKKTVEKKLTRSLPPTLPTKNQVLAKKPSSKTKLYYRCLSECCKGKNITLVTSECKKNAPTLVTQKNQAVKKEVQSIRQNWKAIGESLMKIVHG